MELFGGLPYIFNYLIGAVAGAENPGPEQLKSMTSVRGSERSCQTSDY